MRTLLITESDIGTIKNNISKLPIHIHVSDGFLNKKEIIRGFLDLIVRNFKQIIPGFSSSNTIISLDGQSILNESDSIVLISFSIEFANKDRGFVMLSLPHDLLKYLKKQRADNDTIEPN